MATENLRNLVEEIAADNLVGASKTFKTLMAQKLAEQLGDKAVSIQRDIAEQYPDIFDSPVDQAAADADMEITDYPEDSEEDGVEPSEGEREADHASGEDEEVYEQIVVEADDEDEEDLQEDESEEDESE